MIRVLFLSEGNACRGRMAEAFARAAKHADVEVVGAGIDPQPIDPLAVKVMSEAGLAASEDTSGPVPDARQCEFDVLITLCHTASETCPHMPGHPFPVNWNIANPAAVTGEEDAVLAAYRQTRDDIGRLVNDLFERGYLSALVEAKNCADTVLDNISDGILAHDGQRRIFYFNDAAERITGYRRPDVVNRDCHEVFPGNFCSGRCMFCDDKTPKVDVLRREQRIIRKSGEERVVDVSIRHMEDRSGNVSGVLVMFHDLTREHRLARRVREIQQFSGIIGRDDKMLAVFDLIRDVADTNVPVLVQGESGTGKELVAAAIHNESPRANNLFVPVNCGALPEALLESELFGHVKGAFTGAIRDKKGRFELADKGTIFLDEIGDITPSMQVKLLRVLQDGCFERVGSERTLKVSTRIISATNKDISEEIAEGRFREDLYYRLSVVPLWLPPLRERRNDIPLLVEHILERVREDAGRAAVSLSREALDVMMSYDWPGNVRELQNWLQFAMVKCKSDRILPEHLPPARPGPGSPVRRRRRRKLDAATVRAALVETGDNKVETARLLGVSRATLYRFLNDLDRVS